MSLAESTDITHRYRGREIMSSKGLGRARPFDAICMVFCVYLTPFHFTRDLGPLQSLESGGVGRRDMSLCITAEIISRFSRVSQHHR